MEQVLASPPDAALLAAVLADAPVGFAWFDREARFVLVNASLAAASQLTPAEHVGRSVADVAPEMAATVAALVHRVLRTGQPVVGVPLTGMPDRWGRTRHWTSAWYPARDPVDERVVGVCVIANDVSEQVGLEERLRAAAQHDRETALTLQRSLLPALTPSTEELQLAVRYVPGVADTEVGGDWYDVVPLGGGRLALVIGDVMGRGIRAAAVMGQLRTAVRTCAQLDLPPRQVVEVLDSLVADLGDGQIATFVYAVFDPHSRELLLASAGHLPPVVRRPRGTAEVLAVEVSAPLGVGDAPVQSRVRLEPGTLLALCTDGLVEVRGSDLDAGLQRLADVLADGSDDLEVLADQVLGTLVDAGSDDDVALLLARVPLDVDSRSRTVVVAVPRERSRIIEVRDRARSVMRSWSLLDDVCDTAVLLVSELITNALVHGLGRVELRLRLTRDRLVIEAVDDGHHMPRRRTAAVDEEGGRGLQLIASLSSRWGSRATDDGKVVWAELDLARLP